MTKNTSRLLFHFLIFYGASIKQMFTTAAIMCSFITLNLVSINISFSSLFSFKQRIITPSSKRFD